VFSGQFNGQVAIYEPTAGTHDYNAMAPSGAWLSGDGSLSLEWGRFYEPTTQAGAVMGATANGFTWDNTAKVMYYATGTAGILAIERHGTAAPFTYEWRGNLVIHTADEPYTHIYRPLVDQARGRIWLPIGQQYVGAYPPATAPDLAQWIIEAPLEYWLPEPEPVPSDIIVWPNRTESVEWRVYDKDDNELGVLMADRDHPASVGNEVTRSIRRNVTNLAIPSRPVIDPDPTHIYAEDIDVISAHVRLWWTFGDDTRWPLGKFVFADDSKVQWSGGAPHSCALADQCAVLDQPIDASIGYGQGSDLDDALAEIATHLGFSTDGIDASGARLGVPIGWTPGRDTWLTVMDTLCKNAGFLPPYFDNDGLLRCRTAPDLTASEPEFVYGYGDNVVPGTAVFSDDLLTAPNRYIVTGGKVDEEIVGIYDIPDAAPNSFANRGRYVTKSESVQGIETATQANAAAKALYTADVSTLSWLSFDGARVDPRHDTWNIVAYDGVNFREVAWSFTAKAGSTMKHSLRGVYAG
jgi:hypothetical protein